MDSDLVYFFLIWICLFTKMLLFILQYLKSKMASSTAEDTVDTTAIEYMWDTHQAAIDIATAKFNSE